MSVLIVPVFAMVVLRAQITSNPDSGAHRETGLAAEEIPLYTRDAGGARVDLSFKGLVEKHYFPEPAPFSTP